MNVSKMEKRETREIERERVRRKRERRKSFSAIPDFIIMMMFICDDEPP